MSKEFPLLRSRKFWILVMDLVVSCVLFFGAKYIVPSLFDDVKFLIGILQAPVLFLITAYTVQNSVAIAKG